MADQTRIEWCDSTFNPWIGCTRVSPACDHCYAAVSTPARAMKIAWGAGQPRRRTSPATWKQPLRWNAEPFLECMGCGWRGEERASRAVQNPAGFHPPVTAAHVCPTCMEPLLKEARRRVFCASLADVFDNEVDPQWRADLLELIDATPNLDWLLLTKRIGNVVRLLTDLRDSEPSDVRWGRLNAWLEHGRPPENVWLGITVCNQAEADRDIPKLLRTPAAVRFLSVEPMLGPMDLERACELARIDLGETWNTSADPLRLARAVRYGEASRLDWVIAGGESGTAARPMHPDWVRALRDQCADAGVPFLFKQWGEWGPIHQPLGSGAPLDGRGIRGDDLMLPDPSDPHGGLIRVGKKRAGRTLDGATHTAFPEVR